MRIKPINPISAIPSQLPKKELTVHGCCDNIDITVGNTTVMFGRHRYDVVIHHCKNCGSAKANSHIKHVRGQV